MTFFFKPEPTAEATYTSMPRVARAYTPAVGLPGVTPTDPLSGPTHVGNEPSFGFAVATWSSMPVRAKNSPTPVPEMSTISDPAPSPSPQPQSLGGAYATWSSTPARP